MLPSARYSPGLFLAMACPTTFVETASLTILAAGANPSREDQIGWRPRLAPSPGKQARAGQFVKPNGYKRCLIRLKVVRPRRFHVRGPPVLKSSRLGSCQRRRQTRKVTAMDRQDRRVRGCLIPRVRPAGWHWRELRGPRSLAAGHHRDRRFVHRGVRPVAECRPGGWC
jgi:hypothetical protein